MKTFFKNIGNTIVKKLRKHPLICNFVLSVVLAFVLELSLIHILTGRQIPEALIPYADAVYEISTIKES